MGASKIKREGWGTYGKRSHAGWDNGKAVPKIMYL
jgi:hypothetical protein